MNVAYHSSDSFASILATSIASLFENNKGMDEIHVYIIEEKITDENKRKLKLIAENYNRKIYFIPMPDINKVHNLGLRKVRKDWIFNSYCRLFLDQLLPIEVHRVLYLDSDILITGDLSDLWELDMNGYCVAGVKDCLGEGYYRLLGLSKDAKYCNSGMILQNLDQWRNTNVGDRIREYVHKNGGYVFFMEQSVYNVIFQGRILILPPEYNTYTIIQYLSYEEILKLRRPRDFYSEEEIESAVRKHKIVHLTSTFLVTNRAWFENTNHPAKEEYQHYKNLTPWKDEPDFVDNRTIHKKIIQFFVDYLPRGFVLAFAELIYNSFRIYNIKRLQKKYRRAATVQ